MKSWKKRLSILMCIVMLVSMIPSATVRAEEIGGVVESYEEAAESEETEETGDGLSDGEITEEAGEGSADEIGEALEEAGLQETGDESSEDDSLEDEAEEEEISEELTEEAGEEIADEDASGEITDEPEEGIEEEIIIEEDVEEETEEEFTSSNVSTTSLANTNTPAMYIYKKTEDSTPSTIAVKDITLDKTSASLIKGQTTTLKATVSPSDATDNRVTWESSNTSVATVSNSGEITAVGEGEACVSCGNRDCKHSLYSGNSCN